MKTKLISVLIIVAVVLGGIAGYISLSNKNGQKENPPIQGHDLRTTSFVFSFDDPNYFANAPQYKFPLDLSEVSDYEKIEYYFSLTQEQSEFLKNKGFVGLRVNWDYDDFALAYRSLKKSRVPIFITTDSMFHTYHIFFDDTLRSIEEQYLFNYTKDMTIAMLEKSKEQYESTSGDIKEAARKNVAYFSVALRLLVPEVEVTDYVVEEVDEELSLIKEHKGYAKSPIFDKSDIDFKLKYLEDYSQYKPRGHYTRSDMLKKYFKAMMWYGRMIFRAKSNEETIGAIILADGMKTVEEGKASDLWKKIYEVTAFFVGLADDLVYEEYINATVEVYGTLSSNYNELSDAGKLSHFKGKLKQIRQPKICSSFVTDQENMTEETLGLRFMGQRFIPDSYMFQELVYDEVFLYEGDGSPFTLVYTIAGPIRGFPRGLDVMAVLGSDEAEKILDSEGDTEYDNYDEQLSKLREEFFNLEESIWTQNLYWGWLYTEKALNMDLEEQDFPTFMKSKEWKHEKLNTNLASWAELRHDTILYAKQSTTAVATSVPPVYTECGYVEPIPEFYSRLGDLTEATINGLSTLTVLSEERKADLEEFKEVLDRLEIISIKELENEELTEDDYTLIRDIGDKIEDLIGDVDSDGIETTMIADVHTDPNSGKVLEEGVGYIQYVVVVIKRPDGSLASMAGPIFSYYEFKQPMNNRLADEEWKDILKNGNEPAQQDWAESFII